jgi:hypothetical protein
MRLPKREFAACVGLSAVDSAWFFSGFLFLTGVWFYWTSIDLIYLRIKIISDENSTGPLDSTGYSSFLLQMCFQCLSQAQGNSLDGSQFFQVGIPDFLN